MILVENTVDTMIKNSTTALNTNAYLSIRNKTLSYTFKGISSFPKDYFTDSCVKIILPKIGSPDSIPVLKKLLPFFDETTQKYYSSS